MEAFGMGGEGVIVVVHDCGVSDRRPPNPCIAGVALVRFLTSAALTAHLNGGKPRYQECLIMWCGVVWCGVVWCDKVLYSTGWGCMGPDFAMRYLYTLPVCLSFSAPLPPPDISPNRTVPICFGLQV